ncbi:hypothetical protein [Helicobacter felis]|nr:hypothetical protein [Helicobacter felis]
MTIFIENSPELQSARRYILVAMSLGLVLWLAVSIGLLSWFLDFKGLFAISKSYLFLWLTMFIAQVVGYYKLAKVSRNLLLFRYAAFPYIADALLSLCGLLLSKSIVDIVGMALLKFLTLVFYAYYSYCLCAELTRVTKDPLFKRGVLVIGLCFAFILSVGAILGNAHVYRIVIFGVGALGALGALVGWGMIMLGFVRLKQISYP